MKALASDDDRGPVMLRSASKQSSILSEFFFGPLSRLYSGAIALARQADPELEQRILEAAGRRGRGGEKALTMRAVAKAAGTTTPTVYERYRDRDDFCARSASRPEAELFASLCATFRTLEQGCQRYLEFALKHRHAYEVLYVISSRSRLRCMSPGLRLICSGKTNPSSRWDSAPAHSLMLAIWSLVHGTAMLLIRGSVVDPLRTQMFHSCLDAIEVIVDGKRRQQGQVRSRPPWPPNLFWEKRLRAKSPPSAGERSRVTGDKARPAEQADGVLLKSLLGPPASCAFSFSRAFCASAASGPWGRIFR